MPCAMPPASGGFMDTRDDAARGPRDTPNASNASNASDTQETYSPWTIVNLVFHHLADEGLHPILGESGDPGAPAAALLQALGITPLPEGDLRVSRDIRDHLAEIRAAVFGEN